MLTRGIVISSPLRCFEPVGEAVRVFGYASEEMLWPCLPLAIDAQVRAVAQAGPCT